MRKSPGLTSIAILALALGMGANTAIFSAVNAVLLNSLAMRTLRDPDRTVMVWERNLAMMAPIAERMGVALKNLRGWESQSRSFEQWAAFTTFNCNLSRAGAERPERVDGVRVTPNFFSFLRTRLAAGRTFTAHEADNTAIVTAELYKKRFGNDLNLNGKTIRVNGVERSIVGVLPPGFELPSIYEGFDRLTAQVWTPLDVDGAKTERELWAREHCVYARLRPGVTLAQARTEMNVIGQRLAGQYPEQNNGFGLNVFSVAQEDVGPDLERSMLVLQIAVGFVLLIACANVANLLLARAMHREREISIRLALGAGRGRMMRLMLTESLLLSLAGAAAGLLIAYWSLSGISALAPEDTHALHELRLDPLVLAFTFAVAVATGLMFGLAPAFHAARQNINESLAKGGRSIGSGSPWVRNGMVAGEVALALILLVGAGLMIRTLSALSHVNLGFRTAHLLAVSASLTNQSDQQKMRNFCDQLLDRVTVLPGVKSASVSSGIPLESVSESNYELEGAPKPKNFLISNRTQVTETFFQTLGIPILHGRNFTRAETEAKRPAVAVVSESFARKNWPNQDPIGKVVRLPDGDPETRVSVIGVVGNTHQMGPDSELKPELYLPSRIYPEIHLAARTAVDPMSLASALERAVWSIDPEQPVQSIRSMDLMLHQWLGERRFYMTILAGFAALALVLASLGMYGVLAYVVTLRTRELGIRMALGAATREVLSLVMGQGLKLTLLGIVAGIAGALLLTRLMASLIFGVSPSDPVTFVVAPATLIVVALLACYIPARRASKIDPMQALRVE